MGVIGFLPRKSLYKDFPSSKKNQRMTVLGWNLQIQSSEDVTCISDLLI
jgi:hypothetical protein